MNASFIGKEYGVVYIHDCSEEELMVWAWRTGKPIEEFRRDTGASRNFNSITFVINNIEIKLFSNERAGL